MNHVLDNHITCYNREYGLMLMYSEHMVSGISASLKPRISVLDFVSQLQDKIQDGKPGFKDISQHDLFPSTVLDKHQLV